MEKDVKLVEIVTLLRQISSDISKHKNEIPDLIKLVNDAKNILCKKSKTYAKDHYNAEASKPLQASDSVKESIVDINVEQPLGDVLEEFKNFEAQLRNAKFTKEADLIQNTITEIIETALEAESVDSIKIEIDFSLLEDAVSIAKDNEFDDKIKTALDEFSNRYREISNNLNEFRKEVEAGMFKPGGSGNAGELYELICMIVKSLKDTAIADIPWVLMNQLASILNHNHQAYDAAYRIMQALLLIKTACPSAEILEKIDTNKKQFQKNHNWQELEEMIISKDYIKASLVLEKLMEIEDCPDEYESLQRIKSQVIAKSSKIPWLFIVVSIFIASIVVGVALVKAGPQISGRVQTYTAKKNSSDIRIERFYVGNSSLREELPPLQPTESKLNIYQVRFLVFQNRRIQYLKEQKLSLNEQRLLKRLQVEYDKRCKFYKHLPKDKDQVILELKEHEKAVCSDAAYMLKSWEQVYGVFGVVDKAPIQAKIKLLDLKVADNVKKIQERLHERGFYKGRINKMWNKETRNALMSFKVMELQEVDGNWDIKTQNALLGKYVK